MINFKFITSGNRRNVILWGKYAIKIPTHKSFVEFILGIMENLHERYWYSADGTKHSFTEQVNRRPELAGIYWADRFGFILVQERLDTNLDQHKTFNSDYAILEENVIPYLGKVNDLKPQNCGYRGDTLVVLDYGYFPSLGAAYLGT